MPVMNYDPLVLAQDPEVFRPDRINYRPRVRMSGLSVSAMRPYLNTRNHYYPELQARTVAPTNPPVKAAVTPNLLAAIGQASSYRLPDELLRQYALGTWLHQNATTFYKTANR